MNNLYFELTGKVLCYADDYNFFDSHCNPSVAEIWLISILTLPLTGFQKIYLLFMKLTHITLFILNIVGQLESSTPVKLLGFTLNAELGWSDHLDTLP